MILFLKAKEEVKKQYICDKEKKTKNYLKDSFVKKKRIKKNPLHPDQLKETIYDRLLILIV